MNETPMVDHTSSYTACPHSNGFFSAVHFWFFRRKVFCCMDCCEILDAELVEILHAPSEPTVTRQQANEAVARGNAKWFPDGLAPSEQTDTHA